MNISPSQRRSFWLPVVLLVGLFLLVIIQHTWIGDDPSIGRFGALTLRPVYARCDLDQLGVGFIELRLEQLDGD